MASYEYLPTWKTAEPLAPLFEELVRRLDVNHPWIKRHTQLPIAQIRSGRIFPRYLKHALGVDFRRQAYAVRRVVVTANGEREGGLAAVGRLVLALALAFPFAPAAWAQAACTAGNPNANVIQTTPTADFDAAATDGTVIHTKTGLMWKRCAEGQTWNGATCTGTASPLTWQSALAAATTSTFAAHDDWRLPSVKELQSIAESCGYGPTTNTTMFPATPSNGFWTATSYHPDPNRAWYVGFYVGTVGIYDKIDVLRVRLVRGGQSFNSFDLLLGAVTVSKAMTGAAVIGVPAGTAFPITLTCGATTLGPLNATTAAPAVFTNVPLGDCTVAEGTLPAIAGVTWDAPAYAPSQTVTVTGGATTAVTVTNTANTTTYPITTTASPTAGGTVSCDTDPVPHNGRSTCTATANAGYTFSGWSDACAGTGACTLSNVTAAQSVTANFTLNSYAITATASPATGGTVSCDTDPVPHNGSSTCTATANAGYTFGGFSGDCSGASCTLSNVTGPRNVTALFTLNNYAILFAANPSGGGAVSCAPNPVAFGGTSSCTATANAGYTFANWSGDCAGATCTLSNVTDTRNVAANFTLNSYAITVAANPPAGGAASCAPNPVDHGDNSSCTATANAGYTFTGWSGDCTGTGACALTNSTAARSVTATFTLNTYPITATPVPAAGGTVSCTPNPVPHGGGSSCTAAANAGYTFTGWSGDCTGTGACILSNVTGVKSVTAAFTQNTYPITVTANLPAGGTVSCTPNPVNHGDTATCTATANAGYIFSGWSVDCTGTGACILSNVTGVKSVTAAFAAGANKTFNGPTATGTGDATATVSGVGDTCGFSRSQFVAVSGVPAAPPAGYTFPHGLFDFALANCAPGGTVTVTIAYPTALPAGTVYWKYGPTPGNASPDWYQMPAAIAGNTATFSITDGGLGDDDLTADGGIVDQGGPGTPDTGGAADIPTLSEWAMLLLLSLLLGLSGWQLRRKGAF